MIPSITNSTTIYCKILTVLFFHFHPAFTPRFDISLLDSESRIIFEMIDTDEDGSITFEEFEAWCNFQEDDRKCNFVDT